METKQSHTCINQLVTDETFWQSEQTAYVDEEPFFASVVRWHSVSSAAIAFNKTTANTNRH